MSAAGWIRFASPLIASAAPIVVIATISVSAGWQDPLPDIFLPATIDVQSATNAATTLTTSLMSLSVGVLVGIGYALKEAPRTPARLAVAAIGCCAAIASIYASYRFQSALSQQLFYYKLDFDRIRDRLETQSWTLLIEASCLVGLFVEQSLFPPATPASAPTKDAQPPRGVVRRKRLKP